MEQDAPTMTETLERATCVDASGPASLERLQARLAQAGRADAVVAGYLELARQNPELPFLEVLVLVIEGLVRECRGLEERVVASEAPAPVQVELQRATHLRLVPHPDDV